MTRPAPLREGLTEPWPNVGCTQERLLDPAAAGAPRPRPGATRPRKSSRDSVAAAFQGLWKNHNTHLAPVFSFNHLVPALVNVAIFCGLLGPSGFNSLYQMSFQQWNRFSPCGLRISWTPFCSWDSPFPPEHLQVSSCGVAAFALPLFTVLVEFTYSPFSFLPF